MTPVAHPASEFIMLRPTEKIGAEIGSSCAGSYASCYVRAMRMVICILAVTAFSQPHGYAAARGKAEHVIVMVWDGMRPDFIGAQHTPTLYGLAQEGSYFQHHHAVFVPTTEVNAVALNTGVFPERSGISANRLYRPEIDRQNPVAIEARDTVRRGDLATQGHY